MILASATDMVVLDFESTGSCEGRPNIPWQIGAVFFRQGRVMLDCALDLYLRVPESHPFNPYAPGRWASLREELALAPSLLEMWPQLSVWLQGRPLIAHHAGTERGILRRAFACHDFPLWVDTLKLARLVYPDLASYQLGDLLAELRLLEKTRDACPGKDLHDALFDAVGCGYLLEHVLHLPGWSDLLLEDLLEMNGKF